MADDTEATELSIEWHVSSELPTRFANHFVAQTDEHDVHLSFFELRPPVVLGTKEERHRKLMEMKTITAECVARIVVSRARFPAFVKVMLERLALDNPQERPQDNGDADQAG